MVLQKPCLTEQGLIYDIYNRKNPPEPNESSGGYFFSFSALIIKNRNCFCTNEIHHKVDFQQADGTFQERLFFKAYIFSEINSDLLMLQHRPAFHIRSVQMSTERKMCCMESFLVTICTAPFLCGMFIL